MNFCEASEISLNIYLGLKIGQFPFIMTPIAKNNKFRPKSAPRVSYYSVKAPRLCKKNEEGEFLTRAELEEEKETNGEVSTMATIPESDLKVSHDIVKTSDGSSEERYTFYANYEWQTSSTRSIFNGSVKNDKVGIALPSGWKIVSGSDKCKEFQSGIGAGMGNGTSQHGNCNGALYDANFYGYAWSLTGDDDVWHSGWVSLKAARTSSNLF